MCIGSIWSVVLLNDPLDVDLSGRLGSLFAADEVLVRLLCPKDVMEFWLHFQLKVRGQDLDLLELVVLVRDSLKFLSGKYPHIEHQRYQNYR